GMTEFEGRYESHPDLNGFPDGEVIFFRAFSNAMTLKMRLHSRKCNRSVDAGDVFAHAPRKDSELFIQRVKESAVSVNTEVISGVEADRGLIKTLGVIAVRVAAKNVQMTFRPIAPFFLK